MRQHVGLVIKHAGWNVIIIAIIHFGGCMIRFVELCISSFEKIEKIICENCKQGLKVSVIMETQYVV